jgi:hypothetical protein
MQDLHAFEDKPIQSVGRPAPLEQALRRTGAAMQATVGPQPDWRAQAVLVNGAAARVWQGKSRL